MKTAISSFALALLLTSPVAADQAPTAQSFMGNGARTSVPAIATPGGIHPAHAVLRYDLSTAGSCRAWSDRPPELCVLFALHLIHLSEHPPKTL
jgi:hypothetical protein